MASVLSSMLTTPDIILLHTWTLGSYEHGLLSNVLESHCEPGVVATSALGGLWQENCDFEADYRSRIHRISCLRDGEMAKNACYASLGTSSNPHHLCKKSGIIATSS